MTKCKNIKKIISITLILITIISTFSITANAASYTPGTYKVAVNNGVNVRRGAGTGYSKVGAASKNVSFTVNKVNGSWGYTSRIKCTNGYKSGWILLSNCTKQNPTASNHQNTYTSKTVTENKVVYEYVTVSVDTSSMENWINSVKKAENYICNSKKGVIVVAKVKSTKTVSWKIPKSAVYSGPGITGYVTRKYKVPSVIQYKVHEHTRNMGFGKSWYYAGGNIVVIYTCNCGYRKELIEWTIPLPDPSESQTTQKVIQGLPKIN